MSKIKRNERIGAIVKILSDRPNHVYTLNYFSELFMASKSTLSEDVVVVRDLLKKFELGELETSVGAAGGVKYVPQPGKRKIIDFISRLCTDLSCPDRILPGGFLYISDLLYMPDVVQRLGEILAAQFVHTRPDFIVTVETKGIPVAMMTARALDCPVVVARRDSKVTEGSVVTINYVSASSKRIQTMSLPRRAVKEGERALIIDDFMKGGGTVHGVMELLREFSVEIAGVGVVIATEQPREKMVKDYKPLIILKEVNEVQKKVLVEPASWILEM